MGLPTVRVPLNWLKLEPNELVHTFQEGNASYLMVMQENTANVTVNVVKVSGGKVVTYTYELSRPHPSLVEVGSVTLHHQPTPQEKALVVALGTVIALIAVFLLRKPRAGRGS